MPFQESKESPELLLTQILFSGYTHLMTVLYILSLLDPAEVKLEVTLYFPDKAIDQFGNEGFWTLIYNQVIFIFDLLV